MLNVIIVTYNNEEIIYANIKSVIENIKSDIQLTVINDKSSDQTQKQLSTLNDFYNYEHVKNIRLINNRFPKFETKSENMGLKMASTKYAILIQADMLIKEKYFDQKLIRIMEKYDDLLLISGRGGQNLSSLKNAFFNTRGYQRLLNKNIFKHYFLRLRSNVEETYFEIIKDIGKPIELNELDFLNNGNIGKIDMDSGGEFKGIDLTSNKVFICESVMRGPLIVDVEKFSKINFFDQKHFFQGWDDHDACARGFLKYGWHVGFVPIQYFSDLRPKKYHKLKINKNTILNELIVLIQIIKSVLFWKKSGLYSYYTENKVTRSPEIRIFQDEE